MATCDLSTNGKLKYGVVDPYFRTPEKCTQAVELSADTEPDVIAERQRTDVLRTQERHPAATPEEIAYLTVLPVSSVRRILHRPRPNQPQQHHTRFSKAEQEEHVRKMQAALAGGKSLTAAELAKAAGLPGYVVTRILAKSDFTKLFRVAGVRPSTRLKDGRPARLWANNH